MLDTTSAEVEHHRQSLERAGYSVRVLTWGSDIIQQLLDADIDLVFNVSSLVEAAILEELEIPYVGSNPFTISLATDKSLAKRIWEHAGLPTSPFVEVHVTSDLREAQQGEVAWFITDATGLELARGAAPVAIASRGDTLAATVDAASYLRSHGPRNLMVWLELRVGGETVSTNWVSFARPKHLLLRDPATTSQIEATGDGAYRVTLTAQRAALWCWLELAESEARYSERFFHLRPGQPLAVIVTPQEPLTPEAFRAQWRVHSLVDTY